ncbi:aldehyde dehydrogenase [Phycicoccus sp. DTK01]|uniref:aldehyde dehydrogenase n=1 Tax=Phycicoccus sp. DTK01 TaxID=2785745 RepID=UPI001A8D63F1|nr:aldehyde dehydrogenase [Phycicoccus sp. DTK01]GIL34132.1 aldehyde dehydrogenase [Phycicoccus sp. DTK01]
MTTDASIPFDVDRLLVGGRWEDPSSTERVELTSPYDESVIGSVPVVTRHEVDLAFERAGAALESGSWSQMEPAERGRLLARFADEMAARGEAIRRVSSVETGVGISSVGGLARVTDIVLRQYADLAATYPFTEVRHWLGKEMTVERVPVGIALGIPPWNAPVPSMSFMVGPALAAGCPLVLKPAIEAPLATHLMAEAAVAAGLPEGVLSILPAGAEIGEYMINHDAVDKIAFTGSTAVGRHIMEVASRRMVRTTLELGGKGAAILCDDVDIDAVAPRVVAAGLANSGQVCAAQTRIIVPAHRREEFVEALVAAARAMPVGDPADERTAIGPLVMRRQRERVEEYIRVGREEGATLALGGGRPPGHTSGWFVEPTVFVDVDNSMRIAREEIFGPVLVVIAAADDDEAVRIANDSDFGLVGSVFSSDESRARGLARRMRFGQVHVNGFGTSPGQPFGGFRQSGIGRKGNVEGLDAYLETRLIETHA